MMKLSALSSLLFSNINCINKQLEIKLMRYIHSTFIHGMKTRIKVNEYLLNRKIPASEILKNLTEDDAQELESIKVNHQYLLSKGSLVPKAIKDKEYLELLCLSNGQKLKYYKFLAKKEFSKENDELRKNTSKAPLYEESEELPIEAKNQFYPKYVNKTIKALETNLVFQAITLKSQEVVFDLSFEDDMYRKEIRNLSKQINFCYSANRGFADPFQMVIANLHPDSITYADLLSTFLPCVTENCTFKKLEDMPMVISDKHYLDLFPGRRIVYLSPDSMNFFQDGEYDHNAVYIIGGIIDKSEKVPLTLSRARREGIEHRSFPIDRYVEWKSGSKSLTLDQTFKILWMARESNGDWRSAIEKNIPSRALIDNANLKFNRGRSGSRW